MCCTESYGARWDKDVKYASPSTKRVSRNLRGYTPYAASSKEQTGDVITFAQFEEWNILTETRNDTESCDESNSESIMMSEQDMENLD